MNGWERFSIERLKTEKTAWARDMRNLRDEIEIVDRELHRLTREVDRLRRKREDLAYRKSVAVEELSKINEVLSHRK